MNYYVLDNENNAYFNEDFDIFPTCKYDASSFEGQPCGLAVNVDVDKKRMQVLDSESNTMIVASTGACKTRRCVFPYILSCIHSGRSMIIHDPKGELYKFSGPTLDKKGYKKIVLNLRDLKKGERYNIFQDPAKEYQQGNKDRGIEMLKANINTIMAKYHSPEDPFWEFSAGTYLLFLALLACNIYSYEDVTIENIFKLHVEGNEKYGGGTRFSRFFDNHKDSMLYRLGSLTLEAPNDTKRSIYSILVQALSDFVLNDALCDMTYNSTFDIREIIDNKVAVFIITRDEASVHNALVTSMIDQFYTILIDEAHEKYNGCLPGRIEFILDEFANMGKVKIENMISAARSRNIRFLFCIQSVEQLSLVYGKEIAKVILDNCDNTIYLHSSNMETLNIISNRIGDKTVNDIIKGPLVSTNKLQYLKKGEAIMLLNRVRPFFVQLPDASMYDVEFYDSIELEQRAPQKRKSTNFAEVLERGWDRVFESPVKEDDKANEQVQDSEKTSSNKSEDSDKSNTSQDALKDSRGIFGNVNKAVQEDIRWREE